MDLNFWENKAEQKSRKLQFPAKKPPWHLEHHFRPPLMETFDFNVFFFPSTV